MRRTNISKILLLSAVASLGVTSAQAALSISNQATRNVACASGVCTATAKGAVLNVDDLATMLGTGDVSLVSGKKAGDIRMDASLTWNSSHGLTLDAFHSITFTKPLNITGAGGLTLTYNDSKPHGPKDGELAFMGKAHARFPTTSNNLTINGVSYTLVNNIATLAGDIASNPSGAYALIDDYDAAADGTYSHSPIPTTFNGTFEGLGNAIEHLTINDLTGSEVALFSEVGSPGTLRDIGVTHANVSGADASIGVLSGPNHGIIFRSHASGRASVLEGATGTVGGLVSRNFQGAISQSFADTNVAGYQAGGLVGDSIAGTIDESFSLGKVSGTVAAGGLIGESSGETIRNSYSLGKTKLSHDHSVGVGGFAGSVDSNGSIFQSYSAGAVKGGKYNNRGGFIGFEQFQTFGNCYWDTTTSGTTKGVGNQHRGVAGVSGKTDEQLKSGLPTGFDSSIWAQSSSINDGLPYLALNPPPMR